MVNIVTNPVPLFLNSTGAPLNNGTVYVGLPNVDPVKNPISIFEDSGMTVALPQPLGVQGGMPAINGTPIQVFTAQSNFSLAVFDSAGNLVMSLPNVSAVAQLPPISGIIDKEYVAGVDFVSGTTAQLTLPTNPGAISNLWVFFDSAYQADDQILGLNGPILSFNSPIPVGVQRVNVKCGTTFAAGTPSPGTVTDASVAPNAAIQSSKLSYQAPPSNSIVRTVLSRLSDFLSSFDFNAKADDTTDDTTAIQNLINAGGGWLGVNKTYKINGALTLDVSQAYLEGRGCVFDFTGGGTLQVYSSAAFPAGVTNTTRKAIRGVRFNGPNTIASIGLTVGHETYTSNAEIVFEACSFFQFGKLVEFIDNAWRIRFVQCAFEQPVSGGYHLHAPTTLSNSGEVMQFDHCWFADSTGDLYMGLGQWIFNACSIGIGATIHGLNSTVINLNGCNVESQPSSGYRMIFLQSNASCVVNGGDFIINGGTTWNLNPILLEADCSIHFFGTNIPFNSPYQKFENDLSKLRVWVAGAGRVTARGISSQSSSTLTGSGYNSGLSKQCNQLANGDAEYGNTNNWTVATFGTAGSTVTADATAKLNGNYGFDVQTVSGGGVTSRQTLAIPDAAGRLANFSYAYEVASGSGTVGQIVLRCLDPSGANLSTVTQNCLSTDVTWTYGALCIYAPPGTTQIQCEFNGQLGPGRIYFDELCLNVM